MRSNSIKASAWEDYHGESPVLTPLQMSNALSEINFKIKSLSDELEALRDLSCAPLRPDDYPPYDCSEGELKPKAVAPEDTTELQWKSLSLFMARLGYVYSPNGGNFLFMAGTKTAHRIIKVSTAVYLHNGSKRDWCAIPQSGFCRPVSESMPQVVLSMSDIVYAYGFKLVHTVKGAIGKESGKWVVHSHWVKFTELGKKEFFKEGKKLA